MKNCAKIIAAVMVLFIGAGYAAAYSPSNFKDLFIDPKLMWYCSQNSASGISGACAAGWYYYTENVSGFRDQNNPNDPKILCQKDTACIPEPTYMMIGSTYHSTNTSDGKVPSLFRVYIPPGITGINMTLYVSPVRVAVVARMGQPPVNPSRPDYGNIQTVGLNMNDLMNGGDFWTRNGDGNIQIFYGGGVVNQTVLQAKGFSERWLYFQVVDYDGAWLEKLTFNMSIGDMAAYKAWYNSANWDCYNNPGTAMCSGIVTPTTYTVNFTAGAGGTVSSTSPQTITQGGSTSSVTATPNSGYTFLNWKDQTGKIISTSATLPTQTITSAMTYTANFQQLKYTVSFTAGVGGSISDSTSQVVTHGGSTSSVTATQNNGYEFVNWTGTGGFTSIANPLTVTNVTSAMDIMANFKPTDQLKIHVDVLDRQFKLQKITVGEVKGYSSMLLVPDLTFFNLPSGTYDLYAVAEIKDNDGKKHYYVFTQDASQQIIFYEWMDEDEVGIYETRDLQKGDHTIIFTAFESLKKYVATTLLSPQTYASYDPTFWVAIAPKGSSNLNTLINNGRGAGISFSPDIK